MFNIGDNMRDEKFHLFKENKSDQHIYLEISDLSDTAVQIWQNSDGEKRTYIRIKFKEAELEKIIKNYRELENIDEFKKTGDTLWTID